MFVPTRSIMPGTAPTVTRPRPSRSCARCARRKVRCDKTRPKCSRCAQGTFACSYTSTDNQTNERVTFIDETSSVITDYTSLHGYPNQSEDILKDRGRITRITGESGRTSLSNGEVEGMRDQLGHLYLGPQSKSRYVSPNFFAMISQEVTDINHLLQQQQQYTVDPELYIWREDAEDLVQNGLHTRSSVSTDHLAHPGSQNKSITGQICGDIFLLPPACSLEENMTGSTTRLYNPGVMIDDLPSKEQCESLIWTYMKGYHTISPLFHGPMFLQQARKYIERVDGSGTDIDLHFFALLTAVLFAGCAICSRKTLEKLFGCQSREKLSSRFYRLSVRAIRLTNFPQTPSLYTLSAFIIVDTTWLREEQPLTCCSFIGLAIKVAQMLGLHKDPESFPEISTVDIQIRRQLWWSLVSLDMQVALASGLPPIVDCSTCQVKDFSEAPEDLIGIQSRDYRKSVLGILVKGKIEFYKNANNILRVTHSNRFLRQDLDYVLEIIHASQADLTSRQQQISEIESTLATSVSINDNDEMTTLRESQSNPVLARFAKAVLSLFATKSYVIIQGLVRRQNLHGYLLEKDSQAVQGCRKYLHEFLMITQSIEFQPWHWCWPGQHQPLHSIMTLIIHLGQSPDDVTARETRKLVDMAIYMCGPQENNGILSKEDGNFDWRPLSVSGAKVWEFIRQARAKVWTNAGLDPVILNCPDRADKIDIDGMEGSDRSTSEIQSLLQDFQSREYWSGGNESWYNTAIDGTFSFDASLFLTGEV